MSTSPGHRTTSRSTTLRRRDWSRLSVRDHADGMKPMYDSLTSPTSRRSARENKWSVIFVPVINAIEPQIMFFVKHHAVNRQWSIEPDPGPRPRDVAALLHRPW